MDEIYRKMAALVMLTPFVAAEALSGAPAKLYTTAPRT